ncbi:MULTISPECIES: carbohydrate ABC transporter permease [Aminobacter]|jgi:glucose/mannose transport system permease protein|uniref:ABC transporter permease n=2 Tax=Aminobacter TaxID=31988 RepID=A0AAC9FDG0_AMIAI|nr:MULTISPECIES: sugar ABC transporter permease [Aminobacter]AMS40920.1 ABC transporter permease [Aminobacter aminovorans]MBA8908985.1 glucose/mannose transport system permease protein [Aminobacter ciceronei]MBA9022765.1 glucose/mannose transport system permease protein [Aminobacter ciceronei]MBB3709263.1 glucose/mannose transport system permease protein [Aminobacter aminovorans]MRX36605.1 ABC transporter permease subunit [Aminobacter sp. MDW-2]
MADLTTTAPRAVTNPRATLQDLLPKIVLAPSFALILIFVYGFIVFTAFLSFSGSKLLPDFSTWVGLNNYVRLFNHPNWITALKNLAIFSVLYIVICSFIGLALAIFLDQKIRGEGVLRPIYLYPMALSFIVTGVAWKWFLDPGIGLEHVMQSWGWESFSFRWIKEGQMAIYTIVIAAVWQSSGFVMAMFLAGLRGVDNEIIKAAQIDGASTLTIYRRIIIPLMRPVFLSAFVVLAHLAIKSYDLVVAMTDGGPGTATWTPALFMQKFTFGRNEMGMGAASAIIMMMMIFAIIVPYLYSELGGKKK